MKTQKQKGDEKELRGFKRNKGKQKTTHSQCNPSSFLSDLKNFIQFPH